MLVQPYSIRTEVEGNGTGAFAVVAFVVVVVLGVVVEQDWRPCRDSLRAFLLF